MALQLGRLTVGTSAVQVPVLGVLMADLKLLARKANTGNVYIGTSSAVTTTTGVLLAAGTPDVSNPFTVHENHFEGGRGIWLIADGANQLVDWWAI